MDFRMKLTFNSFNYRNHFEIYISKFQFNQFKMPHACPINEFQDENRKAKMWSKLNSIQTFLFKSLRPFFRTEHILKLILFESGMFVLFI